MPAWPLDAAEARALLRSFRKELGCLRSAYDQTLFGEVASLLVVAEMPAPRTLDRVPAVTLWRNGVHTFYTRNARYFDDLGWFDVVDPIVEP